MCRDDPAGSSVAGPEGGNLTSGSDREELTLLLEEAASARRVGDSTGNEVDVQSRLFAALYDELRRLAGDLMGRERPGHTLSPTGLVHEAYIRLIHHDRVSWESRAHFFGMAARAMREVLVDHARGRLALKRGGDRTRITLDPDLAAKRPVECDVIDLHASLEKLSGVDARSARVVELRTFAGMSSKEVAHVLGISKRTADGDWKFARMWIARDLSGEAA